jgi:hypothetical protein
LLQLVDTNFLRTDITVNLGIPFIQVILCQSVNI